MVGRWGGDEFVVMLTQTPATAAMGVLRRIVLAVSNIVVPASDPQHRVSTSIGLAGFRPGEDLPSFISRVDQALYQAKNNGRGRVEIAPA